MKVTKAFELRIDNPCDQDFDALPKTSCGVYCGKCEKEVIDFTQLTDVELIDILKRKPDTCGMYRNDQINKFYQFDEIIPEKKPFRLWVGIMTFVAFLGFRDVDAQVRNKQPQQTTASSSKNIPKNARIYCQVIDGNNKPLEYVSVTLGDEIATTDANGLFAINNPFNVNKTEITLHFQHNGETMEQPLYAADVRDVAVTFIFLGIGKVNTSFGAEDIKHAPTLDMTKLIAAGAGMTTNGGRGSNINGGGGLRSSNTITILDGVMIRGGVPDLSQPTKKEGFFKRLFGKKQKHSNE